MKLSEFCYYLFFFFSSRRRHTRFWHVTGVQTCALPICEKIAIFTRRVPVEIVKTLKNWLWVFSAKDNLKNVKLHHIDYDPNMSLWDNFSQNRRPKFISEKIAIFPRRGAGKKGKTRKTWLCLFPETDNLRNLKLHHVNNDPNMSLWDDFRQNRRPKVFSEK